MRVLVPFLVAIAVAGALSGCSDRERLNPLDPSNPSTRVAPIGFAAVAGDGFVSLSWRPATSSDVTGYDLYRGFGAAPAYDSLVFVPAAPSRSSMWAS
jgi:hypothetical protein